MPIQTVFFDMGGTIDTYWYSPEMRIAATSDLQSYLSSYGIDLHLSDRQLYDLVTTGLARYHQWRLLSQDELPPSEVWRNYVLPDYQNDYPQLDTIAEDLMLWVETHYYQRQMRPEIPSVLGTIKAMGLKIGLISNVNSLGQVPHNLNLYGIKHYFDPIVLSSEYKRRKPDPSIFHYAARLSNSPTSECIHIGDRITRDIVGAKRAGFKFAIQIQHDFNHGETEIGASPDFIFNNMVELLDVLKEHPVCRTSQSPSSEKILAVLFDADGVLYYRKNKDQEINAFIKRYGKKIKDTPDAAISQLRLQAYTGQISFEHYKAGVLNLYGITDPQLVSQGICKVIEEKEKIHFFNDTLDTLTKLKNRKLYLGIVTDTAQPLHVKINKLERGGIGHLWDSIISSCEVGVQKPDPKIYKLALKQLGLTPSQALFVGHRTAELEGARKVGMKTAAFNYDPDANADFYIHKFSELANLVILN